MVRYVLAWILMVPIAIANGVLRQFTFAKTMTRTYQEKIRHSSLWNTMVAEYGEAKAERMLKDFKVELKS